jgi:hypothetical protein
MFTRTVPWIGRGFGVTLAGLCLSAVLFGSLQAQDKSGPPREAQVFVYPKKLTPADKLSVQGESIEIKSATTLIWVDLQPGARYSHATEILLITTAGTRVVKADWWVELNGKALFRDGKEYKVDFPLHIIDK